MKLIRETNKLITEINKLKSDNKSIGFVPTMGALHKGHLSLIKQSKNENDISVCSIFVNPVQFNDKSDYDNYPVTEKEDLEKLKKISADIVFIPPFKEVYPDGIPENKFEFGDIAKLMEGKNRPGHFNGVAIVVKRLFEIVKPHRAYFGKKDFQQFLIIKKLVEKEGMNIEIIPSDIVREDDGLAMSSRNQRLNEHQRKIAPYIYQLLKKTKEAKEYMNPKEIKEWLYKQFDETKELDLEYFEIADSNSLKPIKSWYESSAAMGFIVVHLGEVRLIDNIEYFNKA